MGVAALLGYLQACLATWCRLDRLRLLKQQQPGYTPEAQGGLQGERRHHRLLAAQALPASGWREAVLGRLWLGLGRGVHQHLADVRACTWQQSYALLL